MISRRNFLLTSGAAALGSTLLPSYQWPFFDTIAYGVQLYTFRKEMDANPEKTLKEIAGLGIKKIETARSSKGHYYGMTPGRMKEACKALGMELVSGHVHLDDQWEATMEEAVASGQEYLICSSMPSKGQTLDNYKQVAAAFNKAGEACRQLGLKFGYHNHEYEFEEVENQVLYDVLLEETDPELVHMELDLGWVVAAGRDPLHYFENYPGRFPLWHLKDMDLKAMHSTEFGKGGLDIPSVMEQRQASGVKHIFIEQEEYANSPLQSMQHNMAYLRKL